MMITIPTLDLLAAVRDTNAFTARDTLTPEASILLHTTDGWLGVTATTDSKATVAATASVAGDGPGWGDDQFVLTRDGLKHLNAFSGACRRPEGQPPHEIQLIVTSGGALQVLEAGGLFPSTADVVIKPTVDPGDWPIGAVSDAIMGHLDPSQAPSTLAIAGEWVVRCGQVAARRGEWMRQHSATNDRCLVSVGPAWTASLPAVSPGRTRINATDLLTTDNQKAA
ncbi:hypothetical protein [Cumulibacter soli]|uniref:hypothetical protein n=1 Tax=Cumulibacter soli TaxID=2546344 RepID=UPI001067371B|nr:hypothetical protein [Cumulibacter soli]